MEDDDFMSMNDTRNKSAAKGRRAKKEPEVVDNDDGGAETLSGAETTRAGGGGPPKPSRRGGWGTESSRRKGGDDVDDERLRAISPEKDNDSDDEPDIPVIPDLEDQNEDDMTTMIAMAPTVAVNRVATYRELDNDLLRHAAFLTLDNEVDLKILAKCLSAESEVIEEDKPWDWDTLFTEVSSELQTEWERAETPEEETKS